MDEEKKKIEEGGKKKGEKEMDLGHPPFRTDVNEIGRNRKLENAYSTRGKMIIYGETFRALV